MLIYKLNYFPSFAIIFLTLGTLSSCFLSLSPYDAQGSVSLSIQIPSAIMSEPIPSEGRFIHPDTRKLILSVTAANMETTIKKDTISQVESEVYTLLATVPAGKDRLITISLYDSTDVLLCEGSTTMDIAANVMNPAFILAKPMNGTEIILGATEIIPSNSGGKTFVYAVDLSTPENYTVTTPSTTPLPALYNPLGSKITPTSVNSGVVNFTALTSGVYFIILTIPGGDTAGTSLKIDTEVPPVVIPVSPEAAIVTNGDQELTLTWTAVSGADSYEVWYSSIESTTSPLPVKFGGAITGTRATITALDNNVQVFLWLKAKNSAGTSDFSPVAVGMPQGIQTALNVTISFINPMDPEFSVTLLPNISAGGTLSLTVGEGFTSYEWVLNGVLQPETNNTITRVCDLINTPGLILPGLNTMTLIVGSGGDYYSAEFTFKIVQ